MSDNNKPTQQEVDADIAEFKKNVLSMTKDGKSITMSMIMDKGLMGEIAIYELDIAPAIREMGLHAPTASELFGVKISISEE